jgi:hypothetical protein
MPTERMYAFTTVIHSMIIERSFDE